jgi:hypothetical protein
VPFHSPSFSKSNGRALTGAGTAARFVRTDRCPVQRVVRDARSAERQCAGNSARPFARRASRRANRDREGPHGHPPPTPPGGRITYRAIPQPRRSAGEFPFRSHNRSLRPLAAPPPEGRLRSVAFTQRTSLFAVRAFDGGFAARPIRYSAFRPSSASLASPDNPSISPSADSCTSLSLGCPRLSPFGHPCRSPGVRRVTFRT